MKKIALVSLALVLALGGLGIGYAMWSDTVTVNTNIATGKVDIAITTQVVLDHYAPPPYYPTAIPDYTCNDGFAPDENGLQFWEMGTKPGEIGKNVSWGESVISQEGNLDTVTLHNTYPSNFNMVSVYVRNVGTIPVMIQKTEVLVNDVVIATIVRAGTYKGLDMDNDGVFELEISYGDSFGNQLEPGGSPAEISYWIHTLQAADQGATYTFTFKIYAVQYNEYIAPLGE